MLMAMRDESWIGPFLRALSEVGVVSDAAKAAGVTSARVKRLYADDADFRAAFDEAMDIAVDRAERELWRRAVEGVEHPVIYKGQVSWARDPETGELLRDADGLPVPVTTRAYSDQLLLSLLKARRREAYGDKTEITGSGGFVIVTGVPDGADRGA